MKQHLGPLNFLKFCFLLSVLYFAYQYVNLPASPSSSSPPHENLPVPPLKSDEITAPPSALLLPDSYPTVAAEGFDSEGNSELSLALGAEDEVKVRTLLEKGISPQEVTNQRGFLPLMDQALEGNLGLVKLLLQYHADPFSTDHSGKTALDYALAEGHCPVARALYAAMATSQKMTASEKIRIKGIDQERSNCLENFSSRE